MLLGIVSPSQANAMRNAYSTLLEHHRGGAADSALQFAAKEKLVELLRQNPGMAEAFVGLLDDAEIALIVGGEG